MHQIFTRLLPDFVKIRKENKLKFMMTGFFEIFFLVLKIIVYLTLNIKQDAQDLPKTSNSPFRIENVNMNVN